MRFLIALVLGVAPFAAQSSDPGTDPMFHIIMEFTTSGNTEPPVEVVMSAQDTADVSISNPDSPDGGRRILVETMGWNEEQQQLNLKTIYFHQVAGDWKIVEESRMGARLNKREMLEISSTEEVEFGLAVLVSPLTGETKQKISGFQMENRQL